MAIKINKRQLKRNQCFWQTLWLEVSRDSMSIICVSSLGKSDNSGEAHDLSSASLPYRKLFYLKKLKCVCLCVRDLGAY